MGKKNKDFIVASEIFINDFKELASLPIKSLQYLSTIISTRQELKPDKDIKPQEAISKLNISPNQFQSIINVTLFIFERILEDDINFNDLFLNLQDIANKHDLPKISRKKEAFKKLFKVTSKYKKKQKILPYILGLNYNFSDVSYSCEARPIFPKKSTKKLTILGYIPLCTIKIDTDNSNNEKENIVFNADIEGLNKLIDNLNDVKAELEALSNNLKINKMIY